MDTPRASWPWALGVVLLYGAAAVLAPGFFHPDEHFQTIEFAFDKIRGGGGELLSWEYQAQIRAWLLPAIFWGAMRLCALVGIQEPGSVLLVLRLLSALVGALSTCALMRALPSWFSGPRLLFANWSLVIFYALPVLHARTSSESWAGSMLMLGAACLVQLRRFRGALWVGGILAAAFWLRFQVGFMVAGLGLWWALLSERRSRSLAAGLGLGFLAVSVAAVTLDRWGYGVWVLTPLRYVQVNLLEGRAAEFGVSPWWKYIGYLWHDLAKPLGAIAVLALPVALFLRPRHPAVWCTAPFVAVHALIGHKEPRFLIPYIFWVPVLAALAVPERVFALLGPARAFGRAVLVSLLILNTWWLLVGHHPPLQGGAWVEALRSHAEREPISAVEVIGKDPLGGAQLNAPFLLGKLQRRRGPLEPGARRRWLLRRSRRLDTPLPAGCRVMVRDPRLAGRLPPTWRSKRWVQQVFHLKQVTELIVCESSAATPTPG